MALQTKLGPGAEVRRGETIVGRHSEAERHVDVSVRGRLGTSSLFVAIDCAHLEKSVDVLKIGVAKTQFEDIGANHGIVVTTKGFSDAALKLAAANGIETCVMRAATPEELAAKQQPATLTVRMETFHLETINVHLTNDSIIGVEPKTGATIILENGESADLDENLRQNLVREGASSPHSRVVMKCADAIFWQLGAERIQIREIHVEARCEVEEASEKVLAIKDGDWVFERILPGTVESERTFFQFADLDEVAQADVLFREVCASTKCPKHGDAAKSVQVVWSLNEKQERQAQLRIEPCCSAQDEAVFAALGRAFGDLAARQQEETVRFAQAFFARKREKDDSAGT